MQANFDRPKINNIFLKKLDTLLIQKCQKMIFVRHFRENYA